MASQALYRKWRSQTFDEIVSQEHVVQTLRNALRDNRVAHAYLFTGPRGTGKTSMARLLAKAVNCIGETDEKPCNKCPICVSITEGRALDLVEIDAASNRGIDEVRDLREKVRFRPNECRYRVYILDEAHMLTAAAFNALLKTLEEPPEHAIFVLVTTEPQNIPITILSRCQRFDFRRIPLAEIVMHLRHVANEEGLEITDDALELVARQATGSMRDALSLLDQLMAFRQEKITPARIHEVLGTAPEVALARLMHSMAAGDVADGLRALNEALDQGAEPRQFNRDLLEYLRGILLIKMGGEAGSINATTETLAQLRSFAQELSLAKILEAIGAFNQAATDLKGGIHPRLPLEMALVSATLGAQATQAVPVQDGPSSVAAAPAAPTPSARVAAPETASRAAERGPGRRLREKEEPPKQAVAEEAKASVPTSAAGREERPAADPVPAATPSGSDATRDVAWFRENWDKVLESVRVKNRSVVALLNKSCEPVGILDNVLEVGFYHDFHLQKMEQQKNLQILQEAVSEVAGFSIGVKCVTYSGDRRERSQQRDEQARRGEQGAAEAADPIVQEAVKKFGARVTSVRPPEE